MNLAFSPLTNKSLTKVKLKGIKTILNMDEDQMAFKELFKPFLSSLLDTALKQALDDKIITPEESLLLSQIEIDIRTFEKEVAADVNEVGGKVKKIKINTFKDKLISHVKQIALNDGILSKDEEVILTRLEEFFTKKRNKKISL